jgi:hypothetical protein
MNEQMAAYLNPLHFRNLTRSEQNEVEKLIESYDDFVKLTQKMDTNKEKSPDLVNDMLSNIRPYHNYNNPGTYKVNSDGFLYQFI